MKAKQYLTLGLGIVAGFGISVVACIICITKFSK